MASNYNALGFNLMTTGENAGTWGDNTNYNLNYLRDMFGWITFVMDADRTLVIPDNSAGGTYDGRAFIIQLTGSTGGNRVLDIADEAGSGSSPGGTADILKPFLVIDSTTRAVGNTITFKVTGASGILIPQYGNIFCYHDGTDIRSSGMISTRGSAGTRAAQAAYTLPAADGTASQALVTDGSGSVSFGSAGISTGKAIAMALIFG